MPAPRKRKAQGGEEDEETDEHLLLVYCAMPLHAVLSLRTGP